MKGEGFAQVESYLPYVTKEPGFEVRLYPRQRHNRRPINTLAMGILQVTLQRSVRTLLALRLVANVEPDAWPP
jgi:hypothetical protein